MSRAQRPRAISTKLELDVLHRILETISYNLDLDDILREIIRVVDVVAHADEVFIYLLKQNELVLRAAKREQDKTVPTVRLHVGKGITGWVAQHRKPVAIDERAYNDKRFFAFTHLKADKYEAFLSVPMVYHDRLIGVLNVQYRDAHHFQKQELQLLHTIAFATAGAIETARLFEQTAVLSQALESRKVIEKAKGVLMRLYQISEEEAYAWLKKRAMDVRKSMKEVSEAVLMIRMDDKK